jgi:hypothetical protein
MPESNFEDIVAELIRHEGDLQKIVAAIREKYGPESTSDHKTMTALELVKPLLNRNKQIIFVIHGIKDEGAWQDMIARTLATDRCIVQSLCFDDLYGLGFAFGWQVNSIVRRVEKNIRHAIHQETNGFNHVSLSAIGHSFGTYVLLKVLEDNPEISIGKLVLCGSVINRNYRFDKLKNLPSLVINECGARDIWPVVAEGISIKEYGAAGTWGLRGVPVITDRFHDLGHSGFLKESFANEFWKPFFHNGQVKRSPHDSMRRPAPEGVKLICKLKFIVPMLLLMAALPTICKIFAIKSQLIDWLPILSWVVASSIFVLILWGLFLFYFPRPVHSQTS